MSRKRVIGAAVLAVWVVVLGVHVRRQYFKPESAMLALGAGTLAPGTYFYVVRMNDAAMGLASSRLDTVPDGFLSEEVLTLDVPAMDTVHQAVVRTEVRLGSALQLRSFRFSLDSEIGRYRVEGTAAGDSLLDLSVTTGGRTQRSMVPLGGAVLPGALPLRLAASGRMRVGQSYGARMFDPSTLAGRDTQVRVTARDTLIVPDSAVQEPATGRWRAAGWDTVPAWRVEESYGGVSVTSWLDQDGRIVKATSPLGFTLDRTTYELANQAWRGARGQASLASGYGTVIESTAIASNVDLSDARDRDTLAVRLSNVDLSGFDLAGGRQHLRGDTLVVRAERASALSADYRLPYRGGGEAADALGATPLIQSTDPRIEASAKKAVGGTTDPVLAARRLNDWVYHRLRKRITLSVPNATQVLEGGEGDCNEHTVLYVALARAVGLPARTAVGLVYIRGRFYYHAWPEVWLGRWIAVDPTLGQFPADASHLRFINGGLARQVELIRLIGRLRLEVL
ncbi:MAG TPA: transglutaminase-like domain-containing protein [Longimicrobiales bacterium]|nr:transglutaminase-like domain-containing protein [Longimicrobiales bacterium]